MCAFTTRATFLGCTCLMACMTGCASHRSTTDQQRPVVDQRPLTIERFIKIRWPRNVTLAANGNLYYIDLVDGINQLMRRAPQENTATPITDFPDGIGGYAVSENGRWIAITAAVGGDEQYDIYLMNAGTEQIEPLLIDRQTVFGSIVWNRDGSEFAYRANQSDKSAFYIYLYNVDSRYSQLIWDRPGWWYPVDFTVDGMKLTVAQYVSASESRVHEIMLNGFGSRPVTWDKEPWSYDPIGYIDDGLRILIISDYQADRNRLFEFNLTSGNIRRVLAQFADREIDSAALNEERDLLAVTINDDGYSSLHLFSLPGYRPLPGPQIPQSVLGNVRLHHRTLLYAVNNANTPGLVYKWDIDHPDQKPRPITRADTQGIDVTRFPLPDLVKITSFDGLEIPAFLYLPDDSTPQAHGFSVGSTPPTPIPFIVYYHGGPESQFRPRFSRSFQYFLSRGFGIIAPNVRGSAGYGRRYLELDNYKNRMNSVKDGVAAAQWLVDNKYTKPEMIAAYGGSYGGFMVMAAITQAPDLFGAACNVVGIVNFETFLQRTKDYRRKLREAEYGPLTDPEFLKSISPIYLVDRVTTPLLIAHGENDPRVPIHEARQLYDRLTELGREPQLLVFDDEGHGFRKLPNRIIFYKQLADFFESHLIPPPNGKMD